MLERPWAAPYKMNIQTIFILLHGQKDLCQYIKQKVELNNKLQNILKTHGLMKIVCSRHLSKGIISTENIKHTRKW